MRPLFAIIPVALFLALATSHSLRTGVLLDDPGYVALRVAENFRQGNGLVFNPGERRDLVDSPAWLGFLSLASFSSQATLLVQAVGLLLGTTVVVLVLVGPRLPVAGACASLFVGLDGLFASRATSGTSVVLAALWLVVLNALVRRTSRTRGDEPAPWMFAAWVAGAALVRWELVLVAVPAAVGSALADRRRLRAWIPAVAAMAAAGVWFGLRARYFPTTPAYWEPWPPSPAGVRHGAGALADFVVHRPLLGLGGIVLLATWVRGRFRVNRTTGLAWGMAALAAFALLPGAGHDVERHAAALLPLAYLSAVEAVWRASRTRLGLVAALLLVVAQPASTWSVRTRRPESRLAHVKLGQWLGTHALPSTVVGAHEVGALGYYSGLRMEDVVGEVSERVAAARRTRPAVRWSVAAADFGAMLRQEPDLVLAGPREPAPSATLYVPNLDAVPATIRGEYAVYRWAGSPVWREHVNTTATPVGTPPRLPAAPSLAASAAPH